jgi:hypothetical protein
MNISALKSDRFDDRVALPAAASFTTELAD